MMEESKTPEASKTETPEPSKTDLMEKAYKNYLNEAELKDVTSVRKTFEAGYEAGKKEAPESQAEVPPDLNR